MKPVKSQNIQLGRREFFTKIFLSSIALGLPTSFLSCNGGKVFEGTGLAPYKVWEEMLHYLKTSPDHLEGRMQILIESKDPKTMFDFVRDEIYLMPISNQQIGYGYETKWGIKYALRSGFATIREKAELLQYMYKQAGINSKIVAERTDISPEEAATYFFRPIERKVEPDIPSKVINRWESVMGKASNPPEIISLADQVENANMLGDKIWNALQLPETFYYKPFDFRWDNYNSPIVEFEIEGEKKYACLFDPDVPFGNLKTGNPANIKEAKNLRKQEEKVTVKVTYRDSITPLKEKDLISGEWLATDLVGRQLDLLFLNNLTIEEQAVTPINNIKMFTPAISLQAMDATQEFMTQRSIIADPITLYGQQIQLNEDSIEIGGEAVKISSNSELLKKVEKLDLTLKTGVYPDVKLEAKALDASGNIVAGLNAKDFVITEEGKPIRSVMESNKMAPRILIMADISMSMPEQYSGENMKAFIENLRQKIVTKYPEAIITYWETPSSLYTWLLKGSQTNNDLIIYATDGDNNDYFEPENGVVYRSGPPAIVLNVKDSDFKDHLETFDQMASLTNGIHIHAANQKTALDKIQSFFSELQVNPYRFTFSVSKQEGGISVTLDKGRVKNSQTYKFDAFSAKEIGPRIVGVYLEVKYANQKPIKRVLAGWDYEVFPSVAPSQKMADEVNDLFLGRIQILFEGSGPTFSAMLSDVLKAKLSTRKWGEALLNDNIGKAKEAFMQGDFSIDSKALALMSPLAVPTEKSSFTFSGGLCIGIQTFKPGFFTGTGDNQFDYLPTSNYVTMALNAKEAFRTNLKKTAQLAIREDLFFKTSTFSELSSASLMNAKQLDRSEWLKEHSKPSDGRYWNERIFRNIQLKVIDRNGLNKSFWDINKASGELYGILPNKTGGGSNNFDNHIDKTEALMEALSALVGIIEHVKILHPIGGFSLGLVAQYGVTLVKLYAIASEAIMVMDTSGMDEKIKEAMAELACNVAKEIMFATTGNAGSIIGGLDSLIELMVGDDSPFAC